MPIVALWLLLVGLFFPASAADPTGVLRLTASAPGAEVYVDGAMIGNAPVTKYLSTGPHKLRVVADNFEPFVRQVEIQAGRTVDLAATLTPGPGSVEFTGPSGSSVSFGGQTYSVPVRVPSPGAGAVTWHAQAPGFETFESTLQLVKGRNYLIDLQLESSEGVIEVTAKPSGARVALDGQDLGAAPAKAKGQAAGLHGVAVSLEGYGTAYRQIDTRKGGRGSADVGLTKAMADVVVNTGKDDAVVKFNGFEVGRGSTVKVAGVAKGRIEISLEAGEEVVASGKVDVPGSGTLTARRSGAAVVEQKPLTSQWGFWAAVGGGAVAAGTAAAVVVVANEPEPAPVGDVVVTLP